MGPHMCSETQGALLPRSRVACRLVLDHEMYVPSDPRTILQARGGLIVFCKTPCLVVATESCPISIFLAETRDTLVDLVVLTKVSPGFCNEDYTCVEIVIVAEECLFFQREPARDICPAECHRICCDYFLNRSNILER